jgi:hypothetical protein
VIIPSVKLADTVLPFGRVTTSPLTNGPLMIIPISSTTRAAIIVTLEPELLGPRSKGVPS